MKFKNKNRLYFFLLIFVLNSCIIDSKPLGYSVKNCSKDTLFIDLTISDTLPDDIYWGTYPEDTICVDENDTTILYIHGEKIILHNFYRVLPDSTSIGVYPINKDTCYIYIIREQTLKRHTLKDIRKKKLYKRRVIRKKDFNNHLFEYSNTALN